MSWRHPATPPQAPLLLCPNPLASGSGFHLRYNGGVGVALSGEPQLLAVNLVRINGSPALTGNYLVDLLLDRHVYFPDQPL